MPNISVIMGVYNGEHRVTKAVESILNQDYEDFEFIICDDGSTDDSYYVLEMLSKQDNRIVLLKNSKNMGLAPTLNYCLKNARASYIARMDDDDWSHPERFKKQVKFLDENPSYGYVGCNIGIKHDGQAIGFRKFPEKPIENDFLYTL